MKRINKQSTVTQNPQGVLKKIATRLKDRRKELGYKNSDDFAYDSEINRSQYGKYELGMKDMRISTLIKIVNAMGLTIEEFFREDLK